MVFPISEALAEQYQKETGSRVIVGVSGTGGGFKEFCRGETGLSGASRSIMDVGIKVCEETGIDYIELPVAIDALASIVYPSKTWTECMTVDGLKSTREPEAQGKILNWNQVRADFPDAPLRLFGAAIDSGTYAYYTAAIVGKEQPSRGEYTATEDDNVTIEGVSGDQNALGLLGLVYVAENEGKVKTVAIRQAAAPASIPRSRRRGTRPISRSPGRSACT